MKILESGGRSTDAPLRILLVEGNDNHTQRLRRQLTENLSHQVLLRRVTRLGIAYAELHERGAPDAILLGAALPDGEALEALPKLRDLAPSAAILLLVDEGQADLGRWALRRGAAAYIDKRVSSAPLLMQSVRHAIDRQQLSDQLRASNSRFQRLIATSASAFLIVARNGTILAANPAAELLFRRNAESLEGSPFGIPLVAGERVEVDLAGGRVAEMRVLDLEWNDLPALAVRLLDVTHKERATLKHDELSHALDATNTRLEELAFIDPLTDLLSRRGLERVLSVEAARIQRTGSQAIAILLGCDDFKRINETLGHAVGDVVLATIARRLRTAVRPSDYVARVGGDEFLILLPDTRLAEGLRMAERIRLAVGAEPVMLTPGQVHLTVSLGAAALPYDTHSIEEILSHTRVALRESKTTGKNRVSAEGADASGEEVDELLRGGSGFRAVSHPIFDLNDGSRVAYELLSRGPRGAFEMPTDFFRIATEKGILTLVDLRCLKTCIDAAVRSGADTRFHVNLMPSTILDTLSDRLLALFPLDIGRATYCVEISEQQLIGDPIQLHDHLKPLRDAGVLIAMDDVGFGRSSLESLVVLEPDIVKIDQSFVRGVARIPHKKRLLRRLVGVVESLDSTLVAEGVSDHDDLGVLRQLGVRYAQGFLWGKPAETAARGTA